MWGKQEVSGGIATLRMLVSSQDGVTRVIYTESCCMRWVISILSRAKTRLNVVFREQGYFSFPHTVQHKNSPTYFWFFPSLGVSDGNLHWHISSYIYGSWVYCSFVHIWSDRMACERNKILWVTKDLEYVSTESLFWFTTGICSRSTQIYRAYYVKVSCHFPLIPWYLSLSFINLPDPWPVVTISFTEERCHLYKI